MTACLCSAVGGILAGAQYRSVTIKNIDVQEVVDKAHEIATEMTFRIMGSEQSPTSDAVFEINGEKIPLPLDYELRTTGKVKKGDMILLANPFRWVNVESKSSGEGIAVAGLLCVIQPTERPIP